MNISVHSTIQILCFWVIKNNNTYICTYVNQPWKPKSFMHISVKCESFFLSLVVAPLFCWSLGNSPLLYGFWQPRISLPHCIATTNIRAPTGRAMRMKIGEQNKWAKHITRWIIPLFRMKYLALCVRSALSLLFIYKMIKSKWVLKSYYQRTFENIFT